MTAHRLSGEAVGFYRENGYWLVHEPVFSPEKFARLQGVFEEHLENRGGRRGDELDMPHLRDARLFEFLLAPEVLDLVEPLAGPDIGLFASAFISKEPYTGRATPWHEDSAYWEGRFDRLDAIVTVWLALDPVDRENGAMKVIPGTHENGFSEYEFVDLAENTFDRVVKPGGVDEGKAVVFELAPNECSLHDARIIHGADANTSPRRRAGYTMRYFSQGMRYDAGHRYNRGHKLWHARGRNVAGNPVEPPPDVR